MYSAFDLIVGRQYSSANSSRASTTTASTAPQSSARWRPTSMSSPPWPRSIATATTSRPVSLPIQLIATEVSRPPEYARMTRSDMNQSPIRIKLFQVFQSSGQLGAGHRLRGGHEKRVIAGDGADDVR